MRRRLLTLTCLLSLVPAGAVAAAPADRAPADRAPADRAPADRAPADRAPAAQRVLVSTDFAPGLYGPLPQSPYPSDVDDGIAVALALNSSALDVDGLAISFGNNAAEPSTEQARTMVHEVMGRTDVPIAQGATGALPRPPVVGEPDPCVNDGVRLLADELREGPATLLVMGPLTDLACLVRTDRRAAGNIREVLAQIGARPGEAYDLNGRPALFSLNVGVDPAATEAVLASSALEHARITVAPYHLAGGTLLGDARVDVLGGERPEGVWLREQAVAFREFWRVSFADDGLRPWDQHLVYRLIAPQDYVARDVGWRMVDCREATGRNADPACAGHGPTQFPTRDGEPAQLWLGHGPDQTPRAGLQILDAYAEPAAEERFLDTVTALVP